MPESDLRFAVRALIMQESAYAGPDISVFIDTLLDSQPNSRQRKNFALALTTHALVYDRYRQLLNAVCDSIGLDCSEFIAASESWRGWYQAHSKARQLPPSVKAAERLERKERDKIIAAISQADTTEIVDAIMQRMVPGELDWRPTETIPEDYYAL